MRTAHLAGSHAGGNAHIMGRVRLWRRGRPDVQRTEQAISTANAQREALIKERASGSAGGEAGH